MKQFFEYIGLISLMIVSFIFTEKIALKVESKDPIYQEIAEYKDTTVSSESVDATILDEYIIPGLNGLEIDVRKSFHNMKSFGTFNKYYLIYDQVKPDISLEDNKDKIIISGTDKKKSVSIVIESIGDISKYLKENDIKADYLVQGEQYDETFELINNNPNDFNKTDVVLNKLKKNTEICFINDNFNEDKCKDKEYYLVKPSVELTNTNLLDCKSKISAGAIIYIRDSATLTDLKVLISEIQYRGLEIEYLSELISETRS